MKLFLYMMREYFKFVFGILVLCLFLFILFDFIHRTTKYFETYNPTTLQIIKMYALQVPDQLLKAIPIAALLGSVIAVLILSKGNEITAMRAAGMGPLRLAMPFIAGGLILSVASLAIGELLVPSFSKKWFHLKEVVIEGESSQALEGGTNWIRQDNEIFNYDHFDPTTRTINSVKIFHVNEIFGLIDAKMANYASFEEVEEKWVMKGINEIKFGSGGRLTDFKNLPREDFKLPISPEKLKLERRKPEQLSSAELYRKVEKGREAGLPIKEYLVNFHFKVAFPFSALVVSLIGLQFAYRSERATETLKGMLFAFGAGMTYWIVLAFSKTLAISGDVNPVIGAWLPNFLILGYVGVQAYRVRRA